MKHKHMQMQEYFPLFGNDNQTQDISSSQRKADMLEKKINQVTELSQKIYESRKNASADENNSQLQIAQFIKESQNRQQYFEKINYFFEEELGKQFICDHLQTELVDEAVQTKKLLNQQTSSRQEMSKDIVGSEKLDIEICITNQTHSSTQNKYYYSKDFVERTYTEASILLTQFRETVLEAALRAAN